MAFEKVTESDSPHRHLDAMAISDLLNKINEEDKKVPEIIRGIIPSIEALTQVIVDKMILGGRLFYIGHL